MKTYRIAAIPGDGIGNEVIPAGIEVLETLAAKQGFGLAFERFDWSSKRLGVPLTSYDHIFYLNSLGLR